jgi:hypothetical protein
MIKWEDRGINKVQGVSLESTIGEIIRIKRRKRYEKRGASCIKDRVKILRRGSFWYYCRR